VLGQSVPLGYTAGVSDANLFNGKAGIPCIAWGPRAGNFHQCQEWVDLTTITPCAETIAQAALLFLKA
jgi:acetylornithine deacetylase/succinyl-diaminopimelate desuccinylase-like protein